MGVYINIQKTFRKQTENIQNTNCGSAYGFIEDKKQACLSKLSYVFMVPCRGVGLGLGLGHQVYSGITSDWAVKWSVGTICLL